jgi:hypothetical protein
MGTSASIRKALSRLAEQGMIVRLGQGIYALYKEDQVLGKMLPSTAEIAMAIAKKERIKIMPTGLQALNQIGLSSQVPMKPVYLTNGNRRSIRIGKSTLVFRSTTSKKLAMHGSITQLLFLALEELDLDKLTRFEMDRIIALLQQEDPQKLKHDLKLAPARINDFVVRHFLRKP